MLRRILAIAINTFRESVRDRVLLTLLVFALLVMGGARIVQPVALGEADKIVKDLGLSAITLFSVLIAVMVGGRIVFKEVEKRTIYLVLARPVRRLEFILGKYFGLMGVLATSLVLMTVGFYLVLVTSGMGLPLNLLWAVLMTGFELALLTAVAVMFSTLVTPVAGAVFTFAVYVIGHGTPLLKQLAAMSPSRFIDGTALFLYYVLPNLTNFNIRGEVVHGVLLNPPALLLSAAYSVVYTATLLLIAMAAFSRKDF